MLAVVQHWNPDMSTLGPAVIRLLMAPVTATLGDLCSAMDSGLILFDVRDPDIIAPVLGDLSLGESCPIMAGTAGLSRQMSDISRWRPFFRTPRPSLSLTASWFWLPLLKELP